MSGVVITSEEMDLVSIVSEEKNVVATEASELDIITVGSEVITPTYNKWFDDGQADIRGWFGEEATDLFLPGEPASGGLTTKIQGNVFVEGLTTVLEYRQPLTGGADDPLGIQFTYNSTDRLVAADSSVLEAADQAVAALFVWKPEVDTRYFIFGKRFTVPPDGRGFWVEAPSWPRNSVELACRSSSGSSQDPLLNTGVTGATWVFVYRSVATPIQGIYSPAGADETVYNPAYMDSTNTSKFVIGHYSLRPCGMVFGPLILWYGAAAEPIIANRASLFPSWWAS